MKGSDYISVVKSRRTDKSKIVYLAQQGEYKDVRASYNSWRGLLKDKKCYKTKESMDNLFNQLFIEDWRYQWNVNQTRESRDFHGNKQCV